MLNVLSRIHVMLQHLDKYKDYMLSIAGLCENHLESKQVNKSGWPMFLDNSLMKQIVTKCI